MPKSHGFTITSMAFQDAGNLDIERLRQCSLHVYKDGKKIPFLCVLLVSDGKRQIIEAQKGEVTKNRIQMSAVSAAPVDLR